MINAIKLNADASHIKAIMRVPSSARMFRFWSALVKTFVKMVNMTVATTEATMVKRAVAKVSRVKGRERRRMKVRRRWGGWDWLTDGSGEMVWGGREETARGERKTRMKVRTVATMKRPNIQCEATRAIWRASVMSAGRATVGLLV